MTAVGTEISAGNIGDFTFHRFGQKIDRINVFGQFAADIFVKHNFREDNAVKRLAVFVRKYY